ncbi:MAG TPA: 3-oxoacyl-[acyl-carrier-protein] reductase [Candidatus Brocadiia bacterium]|nr:3-oxoacyl-[acyl-carrier-protein] reductase [Candidatus Brocadiia bacterium]
MSRNPLPLKGKTAMITGGARGIGKMTAIALAQAGANCALLDVMDEVKATAAEIAALGVQAEGYTGDVTNAAQIKDTIDQIIARFGALDILVNNAGITRDNLLLRMTDEEWDKVLAINLRGAFVCLRAAARPMLKQRSGRIINIASVVGVIGNAGQCNYSASKAGLIGLTKSAARELASRGITVNAVAPGYIRTAMTDALPDDVKQAVLNTIPLKSLGSAEDVANAVLFLASDDARYVTGHVLHVDGGMAM